VTCETTDFGDDIYHKCEILELSDPVRAPIRHDEEPAKTPTEENNNIDDGAVAEQSDQYESNVQRTQTIIEEPKVSESVSQHNAHNALNGILDGVRSVAGKVAKFSEEHPTLTKIFKIGSALVIAGASTYVAHEHSSRSKNATNNDETTDGSNDDSFELENSYDIDTELETNIDTNPDVPSDETVERNYPDTHASPKEHIVPAGGQHYHTKDGIVWREKEAYRRGGKNEDDE
jgi:hypothetical protein